MEALKIQQMMVDEEQPRRYYTAENPAVTGIIPVGYMTGEEFFSKIREDIVKMYKDRGLL